MTAAALAALARRNWRALAILALLAVTAAVTRSCTVAHVAAGGAKALQRNDAAKDQAAVERRADDQVITHAQQERQNAIDHAPAGETGPATRALNCRRWMQQHPGASWPAGC